MIVTLLSMLLATVAPTAVQPAPLPQWSSPSAAMAAGRDAFESGQWAQAAQALAQANALLKQPDPLVSYDQGVAAYRAGDLDAAGAAFKHAMNSSDPEVASAAAYNLGNTAWRMADQATDTSEGGRTPNLDAAKQHLEEALAHYRSAIARDPQDLDAQANGELTWRRIREVEQQQQQNQEQEKNQDQQQQSQDQQQEQQPSTQENSDAQASPDMSWDQQSTPPSPDQQTNTAPKRDGKMTPEDAKRLLQAVRDREQQRRQEKLEENAAGQPLTGRDY